MLTAAVWSPGRVDLLPFLAVSAVVILTPGVDMAVVSQQVLARGRRAGLGAVVGIAAGSAVQATAAVLGLSALLAASAPALTAVKLVGAAYLVWLGARALLTAGRAAPPEAPPVAAGRGRSVRAGLFTNLLNPKITLFYVAFLPQFVQPGPGAAARTALLAAVFLGLATAWLVLFTALLGRLRPVLARAAVRRWIERSTGAVLVGLGVRLAVDA